MNNPEEGLGRLRGKVAMVTGAGSGADAVGTGIGEAIARLFALEGARVMVIDVDEGRAARTVATVEAKGGEAVVCVADVSSPGQCKSAVEATVKRFGGLHVLINNVGISVLGSVTDLDLDGYQRAMDVNLKSMVLTSRYAVPVMIEGSGGSIVNLSSIVGLRAGEFGGAIPYAVSKGGVIALTTAMAVDHGSDGVRVNCIAPGMLEDTRMTANLDPEFAERARRGALLKRAASKSDVADQAVAFARTDTITGQTIVVDSGVFFH